MLTFKNFHDYQVYGISKMMQLRTANLFIGTGLGKTIMSLTAYDQMRKRKRTRGMLVVAPKKVMYNTWAQEGAKWDHTKDWKFSIIHGDAGRGSSEFVKMRNLRYPADVYLTNYESLPWLADALTRMYINKGRLIPFDMVVYDESTKMKNSQNIRFRKWKPIAFKFNYRFNLTATPQPNGIKDLFGQMYLIDFGQALGQDITSFRSRYLISVPVQGQYTIYKDRPGAMKEVRRRIRRKTIALRKKDYLNLPPMKFNIIELDLPPKFRDMYNDFESEYFLELDDGVQIEVLNSTAMSIKLRQFLQGCVYSGKGEHRVTHRVHTEKLDYLKDLKDGDRLDGFGNTIIAYNFHFERDDLQKLFPNAPSIDSRTSDIEASRYISKWNRGELPLLLVNPASVSHGLNLQDGGNHVIWYSLTWDLEAFSQLNDRLHRQGQAMPVFIHILAFRGTVDVTVGKALSDKNANQELLYNGLQTYKRERRAA